MTMSSLTYLPVFVNFVFSADLCRFDIFWERNKIRVKSSVQKFELKRSSVDPLSKLSLTPQPFILHPRWLWWLIVEISFNDKKEVLVYLKTRWAIRGSSWPLDVLLFTYLY